jgi:hypothetical protein
VTLDPLVVKQISERTELLSGPEGRPEPRRVPFSSIDACDDLASERLPKVAGFVGDEVGNAVALWTIHEALKASQEVDDADSVSHRRVHRPVIAALYGSGKIDARERVRRRSFRENEREKDSKQKNVAPDHWFSP